jgi:hypothetical protein
VGKEPEGLLDTAQRHLENGERIMANSRNRAVAFVVMPLSILALVAALRVDATIFVFMFGVICGSLFSIPATAMITLFIVQQREQREQRERQSRRRYGAESPPVVVVTPGGQTPQLGYPTQGNFGPTSFEPAAPRRAFSIIGDEPDDE